MSFFIKIFIAANLIFKKANLTKVRPLFKPSHRGSDNSPLVFVFSANNIDQ